MFRSALIAVALVSALGISDVAAQAKKGAPAPGKAPTAKEKAITINVFLRDPASKNEILLATNIWSGHPEYNSLALQRFFAVMSALEPYVQDDEVAYTWSTKGKVTKCGIYLESYEVTTKSGPGALVGCESNGVSNVPVTSVADPKHPNSPASDPKHVSDVLDLFKKQQERAKHSLSK